MAVLLVVGFIVFGWPHDGQAQESSTLTIAIEAQGAAPDETFRVRVLPQNGEPIQLDLSVGSPQTIENPSFFVDIFEDLPVGWRFAGLICSSPNFPSLVDVEAPEADPVTGIPLTVPDGEDVTCTLTNVAIPTGTVRLSRVIDGDDADPLARHQVVVGSPFAPELLLANEQREFRTNAGPVDISDFPASGYGRFFIDCADADVTVRTGTSIQVTVPPGGTVECVLITVADPIATLTIEKQVRSGAADLVFPFRVSHPSRPGDLDFEVTSSSDPGFDGIDFALGPGPYEFVELATEGWLLSEVSCPGARIEFIERGFRVEPDLLATTMRCTFINEAADTAVGRPGDANCDAVVDIVDALVIAQFAAQVRTGAASCPLGDAATELFTGAADFDGSGSVDIVDALQVARCAARLPSPACPAPEAD